MEAPNFSLEDLIDDEHLRSSFNRLDASLLALSAQRCCT